MPLFLAIRLCLNSAIVRANTHIDVFDGDGGDDGDDVDDDDDDADEENNFPQALSTSF